MQLQYLHATCAVNVICVANTCCHFELAANTLQTRSVILNVLCHNFYCKHMHSFLLVLQTYAVIVRAAYTCRHLYTILVVPTFSHFKGNENTCTEILKT